MKTKTDRIHLFAFSRGGIMALWTAILRDDISSVVTWAGVSDVVFTYHERQDMHRMMRRVIGGTPNNNPDAYRERTALFRINELNSSVLIIHGMLDEHVSVEQAVLLENALERYDKKYETWYFPAYTHYIQPAKNMEIVRDSIIGIGRREK
mgnify:CR=1 FL=1